MHGGKLIAVALMAFTISALSAGSAAAAEIRVLALQSPQIVMAEVGAKGRPRGTVLAELAAEGDRNRVLIPLLRRAAGEAESVMGIAPPHAHLRILSNADEVGAAGLCRGCGAALFGVDVA